MCLFSSTVICSRCVLHEGALKGCSLPKNDRRERRADGQYSCATKAAKLNWAAEIIRSSKHVLTLSLGHEQHTGAEPGGRGSPLHYSETNSTRWERNVVFVEWFFICYFKPKCLNFICIPHTWFLSVASRKVLQNKLWMLLWQSYAWKFKINVNRP